MSENVSLRDIPSVDDVLKTAAMAAAIDHFGRPAAVAALRAAIEAVRTALREGRECSVGATDIANETVARLEAEAAPNIRAVFNLTGTILHTNLGRAILAEAAIAAATMAMRDAVALEFDLASGQRGERDDAGAPTALRADRGGRRNRRQQQCRRGAARAQHARPAAAKRSSRAAS